MKIEFSGRRIYVPVDDADCGFQPLPKSQYLPYRPLAETPSLLLSRDRICDRCAGLDIDVLFPDRKHMVEDRLFHLSIVEGHDHEDESGQDAEAMVKVKDLGILDSTLQHSPCPLCRLFAAVRMRRAHDADQGYYYLYSLRPPHPFNWIGGSVLAVVGRDDYELQRKLHDRHVPNVRCISCATTGLSTAHRNSLPLRRIQPSSIDYSLVREWIRTCEASHKQQCCVPGPAPKALKLIDCENRRILRALPQWKYSALSYMWGKPQPEHDHRVLNGKLPQALPKTIEDAMEVSKQLGFRYIWIDRYCIDQDDEAAKVVQIKQMDLVYKYAEVAIIATAGDDPSVGLPGVSMTCRQVPPSAWVNEHQLVSFPLTPDLTIQKSRWMTRGWTYQEGLLSRRRVVFTRDQVYFECREGTAYECVDDGLRAREFNVFAKQKDDTPNHPWLLLRHLQDYCGRKLSYEGDALRAFEGVFHDFATRKYPVLQYHGIPIMPPVDQDGWNEPVPTTRRRSERFMVGLRWMNARPWKRRATFPSWSWAGWDVHLKHLDWHGHLNNEADGNYEVSAEKTDGSLRDFDNDEHFSELISHPERFSKYIQFTAWTVPIKIQHVSQIIKSGRPTKVLTSPFLKYKSDYFAIFDQGLFSVEAAAYPLDDYCDLQSGPKRFAPNVNSSPVIGIIFGEHEEAFRDHTSGKRTFIMIARDYGDYFERISQIEISMAMFGDPLGGLFFGHGLPRGYFEGPLKGRGPWEACFVGKERRRIRLA